MAGDLVHFRNSERVALKRCPQQWFWAWRRGLKGEAAKALWFGQGLHLALAHYYQPGYKRNTDFVDVWREFADEEGEFIRTESHKGLDEEEFVEARELGEAMLLGYHEYWEGDPDWDVIQTEMPFQVRIPFEDPNPFRTWLESKGLDPDFWEMDGTLDGVYRHKRTKKIALMEHKSAKAIRTTHLGMDDQAGSYWAIAQTQLHHKGILGKRENISEITYNFLRKALPDERPRDTEGYALNKDGSRSKRQPPKLYDRFPVKRRPKERANIIAGLKHEMTLNLAYRSGLLTVVKTPADHCGWCPFKEMCELHEHDADWEEFRDLIFHQEDPYLDHRKVASS